MRYPEREEMTMAHENEKVQINTAVENTPVEETNLQIEELEARIAPSAVWGD